MPERFAQQALGHGSKAFARTYSRKAKVIVSLAGRLRGENRSAANGGKSMKASTIQGGDGDFAALEKALVFAAGFGLDKAAGT